MAESRDRLLDWIGRLLCWFGFHDYRLIEWVGAFGGSGQVQMRADERLAAGDMEGEAVWIRIVKAIEELLSEERPDDAEVH